MKVEGPFERQPGVDSPACAAGASTTTSASTSAVSRLVTDTLRGTQVPGGTVTLYRLEMARVTPDEGGRALSTGAAAKALGCTRRTGAALLAEGTDNATRAINMQVVTSPDVLRRAGTRARRPLHRRGCGRPGLTPRSPGTRSSYALHPGRPG